MEHSCDNTSAGFSDAVSGRRAAAAASALESGWTDYLISSWPDNHDDDDDDDVHTDCTTSWNYSSEGRPGPLVAPHMNAFQASTTYASSSSSEEAYLQGAIHTRLAQDARDSLIADHSRARHVLPVQSQPQYSHPILSAAAPALSSRRLVDGATPLSAGGRGSVYISDASSGSPPRSAQGRVYPVPDAKAFNCFTPVRMAQHKVMDNMASAAADSKGFKRARSLGAQYNVAPQEADTSCNRANLNNKVRRLIL
ncbi:hypothetical protein GOP47_0004464 [Adiantum capillus-veneris]|uniref:Uncharacterized protein n=1 Tax=Adiantum capillus-veneris TaxID=13818 RepID=A0A9D4ZPQ5_ADICA|nr:hypothetical protein GOP47_0004464 [Adiantum capillus-veneris]